MISDYERTNFKIKYWLIAGGFLVISLFLLYLVWVGASTFGRAAVVMIFIVEIIMTLFLYFFSKRTVDKAYRSIEKTSDMMMDIIEGREVEPSAQLEEGSVGILYNNFDKLVNMFKEGKRREQSEKEYLRDVMSDISHQLKTPLASMEVFIDLLMNDKIQSQEEQKKILAETSNQVSRMEWMVLSMLKLARIEAGAVAFDIKDVDLKMVLEEVRGGTHYLTDSRNQKLSISCPDAINVKADFDWLVEALINIVKNASDYSVSSQKTDEASDYASDRDSDMGPDMTSDHALDNDGENDIEIEVEQNSVFTRIYIRDHGIGMSDETMTHIFERFYRASNEVNPNSVGIGLSLSKSIVEGMGGKISVESELGKGSCFKIHF